MTKASIDAFTPEKQLAQTFSNENEDTDFSPKFCFPLTYNAQGNNQARQKNQYPQVMKKNNSNNATHRHLFLS